MPLCGCSFEPNRRLRVVRWELAPLCMQEAHHSGRFGFSGQGRFAQPCFSENDVSVHPATVEESEPPPKLGGAKSLFRGLPVQVCCLRQISFAANPELQHERERRNRRQETTLSGLSHVLGGFPLNRL